MPYLAPEKRAAGTWTPHPDGRPTLPSPDQSRYGPPAPKHDPDSPIAFTEEGAGVVATCTICGWLTWTDTRRATERAATTHKCLAEARCLVCGPPYRLKDDGCPHLKAGGQP